MTGVDHNAKVRAYRKGLWAEIVAALWLLFQGYWPVARRYKTAHGEIDLVCRRRKTLVFVEVKYRGAAEDALLALKPAQLQRVHRAAEIFLQAHPQWAGLDARIDLFVLAPKKTPIHVKNLV